MDDIKGTKNTVIAKLNALNIDHTIDYKTYEFYLTKVKKLSDHLIRYLETEKILSENLNKLKEVNIFIKKSKTTKPYMSRHY